jgi:hypothetical protein
MVTIFYVNNCRGTISAWENEGYGAGREYQCAAETTRVNVSRVKYGEAKQLVDGESVVYVT